MNKIESFDWSARLDEPEDPEPNPPEDDFFNRGNNGSF
jgi:hypothetical protein